MPPQMPIFEFMQQQQRLSDKEMLETYNNGAGLAIYLPRSQVPEVIDLSDKDGKKAWDAGTVEEGPKQVIIEPLDNLILPESSINIR